MHRLRAGSCALLLLAGTWGSDVDAQTPSPAIRHAVIVSVDGLRPDLMLRGDAPRMHALMRRASYTLWARTVDEGYTVPSHVSMLTGVTPVRHGVTWDNHIEDSYPNVPTVFELAKRRGLTTAMAAGKSKLIVLTKPGTLDWTYLADEEREDDGDVARRAVAIMRDHGPDLLFVHLASFDIVGHAHGWGSSDQMQALKRADDALGRIQEAVRAAGRSHSTLFILTADHGGAGLLHPPEDARSQFIPWMAAGPTIRRGFDLSTVPGLAVTTMSTFATVCALLGIEPAQALDAGAVLDIVEPARRTLRPAGGASAPVQRDRFQRAASTRAPAAPQRSQPDTFEACAPVMTWPPGDAGHRLRGCSRRAP